MVVALVLIPFSPNVWVALVPMGLYGIGSALFSPSISALISRTAAPTERGAVMGLFQGVSSLGRVVGPMAASGVAALAGLRVPFWVAAVISLGGVAMLHPPAAAAASPPAQEDR